MNQKVLGLLLQMMEGRICSQGFKTLQENQKVSFEVTTGPKGDQAVSIKPVE